MITLDQEQVTRAAQAMCDAAQLRPGMPGIDGRYQRQVVAFILALRKNYEREQTYNGLWRQYGLEDCANNAKSKSVRLAHHFGNIVSDQDSQYALKYHDDAMDDALDLINYGGFCAQLVHESAQEQGLEMTK